MYKDDGYVRSVKYDGWRVTIPVVHGRTDELGAGYIILLVSCGVAASLLNSLLEDLWDFDKVGWWTIPTLNLMKIRLKGSLF